MEFEQLLKIVGDEPVFESSLLLAGQVNPAAVRLQLSRWTKTGRLYQLRRGLYALAPPFQKVKAHPFVIANRLQHASYVSLQAALAFYDLIPDTVQITNSVTAGRPEKLATPLGTFEFRHVKADLLQGYHMVALGAQQALVARPEKALLDLVYLQPGGDSPAYLQELRLQNLEKIDLNRMKTISRALNVPKLNRAVETITHLAQGESSMYEPV